VGSLPARQYLFGQAAIRPYILSGSIMTAKRLVGQAGGDGPDGRPLFREASTSALAGFQFWNPLEREAGHVYVTNVDYCGLSERSSFSLRRLKEEHSFAN
jgi:hypothetical protein